MTELVASAVEWLAASGAPNWLVLVALLTSPWTWAREVRKRGMVLLDRYVPVE